MDLRVSDPEREGRSLMCDLPMPRDGDSAGQSACGRNRTSQLGDGWRAFRKGYDMAKYVVKATKFRCGDESGPDWSGSDEPYWIFTAKVRDETSTFRTKVFGNVDSGDSRQPFEDDGIVWPSQGARGGEDGPIELSIQLWESDHGSADKVRAVTEGAIHAAALAGHPWLESVPSSVRNLIANNLGDDLMGSQTIAFSQARLAKRLPGRGASMTERFHFGGKNGDLPFTVAGGPDYDLWLQVTRVDGPEVRPQWPWRPTKTEQ